MVAVAQTCGELNYLHPRVQKTTDVAPHPERVQTKSPTHIGVEQAPLTALGRFDGTQVAMT